MPRITRGLADPSNTSQLVKSGLLVGLHPVREALRAGTPLDRVIIARGQGSGRIQEIIDLCRQASVPVRFEERTVLDRLGHSSAHQGVMAFSAPRAYATLEDVTGCKLLVALDGVEDPHNLGAIIRTAHAAGAGAILVPERRAAPLNETVAKAAAGALEHLTVARTVNMVQALEKLKASGYWIYGLDERGSEIYSDVNYAEPCVFVLGGEGRGLHHLVREHCDFLVRIPMAGQISSLNVSVAAGIVLFDWRRKAGMAQPSTFST